MKYPISLSVSFLVFSFSLFLAAADNPSPIFILNSADGVVASGPLKGIGEDWSVVMNSTKPIRVEGMDFVSLRRERRLLPALPPGQQIIFANGDRIPGSVVSLTNEWLTYRADLGDVQELKVPLSALSAIWLHDPVGPEIDARSLAALRRRLLTEPRTRDQVFLRNGDVVEGTLNAIDAKTGDVQVETGKKEIAIDRDKVAYIALNPELARALKPKSLYGRLVLANGGRLGLSAASAGPRTLTGKTLFGAKVQVPLEQIIALDMRQGRATYLSDLKAKAYQYSPYFNEHWPYVVDGSVAGREIRLHGSTFDKGIGMHSQSALTYELAGGYRWFEASVGLDDQSGPEGSVRLKVLVDGKPCDLGWNKELTWRDGPRPVRINVAAVRELTLRVDWGPRGHVQGHVNWADARLIQ